MQKKLKTNLPLVFYFVNSVLTFMPLFEQNTFLLVTHTLSPTHRHTFLLQVYCSFVCVAAKDKFR